MVKNSTIGVFGVIACIATALYGLSGYQPHKGSEDQLKADVDSFATYYYNWHFPQAVRFCTPESERWLHYLASNVHEADIEQLRNKAEDATVEVNDIDFGSDEVNASVSITVHNFLQMDTIGQEAHLIEQADFQLPLELHQGKWKIKLTRMASLLQNGTKNHD